MALALLPKRIANKESQALLLFTSVLIMVELSNKHLQMNLIFLYLQAQPFVWNVMGMPYVCMLKTPTRVCVMKAMMEMDSHAVWQKVVQCSHKGKIWHKYIIELIHMHTVYEI